MQNMQDPDRMSSHLVFDFLPHVALCRRHRSLKVYSERTVGIDQSVYKKTTPQKI